MEMQISERIKTALAIASTDLVAATPIESLRFPLKDAHKIRFDINLGAGAGADIAFVVKAYEAASGGVASNVTLSLPVYAQEGNLEAVKVDGSLNTDGGEVGVNAGFLFVEVDPLDLPDGYPFVSIQIQSAAARTASVIAQLETKRKPAYELGL